MYQIKTFLTDKNTGVSHFMRHLSGLLFACLGALVFALLVGNAAARLARGLAGGLAFAAAAAFRALAEIAGLYGSDVFHGSVPFPAGSTAEIY